MANEKISEYLVNVPVPDPTDRIDISFDLGGTPETGYMTWQNLLDNFPTIYSTDSQLAGNRDVDLDGNTLGFTNGIISIGNAAPALATKLQIEGLSNDKTGSILWGRSLAGANKHILYDDGGAFHGSGVSAGTDVPGTNKGYSANGAAFQFGFVAESNFIGADAYGFHNVNSTVNAGFANIGMLLDITGGDDNYAILVNNGFSGFGELAPDALIHIDGVGGFKYVDGNEGAGKVLQSDADGVASWAAAAGADLEDTLNAGNESGLFDLIMSKVGTAVSTITQKNSQRTRYQMSLWTGAVEDIGFWDTRVFASTTVDQESRFGFLSTNSIATNEQITILGHQQDGILGINKTDPTAMLHIKMTGQADSGIIISNQADSLDFYEVDTAGVLFMRGTASPRIHQTNSQARHILGDAHGSSLGQITMDSDHNNSYIQWSNMVTNFAGIIGRSGGANEIITGSVAGDMCSRSQTGTGGHLWGNGSTMLAGLTNGGNFFIGGSTTPTSGKLNIKFATEDLTMVDSGSVSATEQDWIEVTVGGNTGFIRVFATK